VHEEFLLISCLINKRDKLDTRQTGCKRQRLYIWVDFMGYVWNKEDGWIGYCSHCLKPFIPYVCSYPSGYIRSCAEFERKKGSEFMGWCELCYQKYIGLAQTEYILIDGVKVW
jgi:hypothetical protein